jgi:hypothetical protein
MKLKLLSSLSFFFKCVGVRMIGLGPPKTNHVKKMEDFSQNAYGYTLEKCVGLKNFFLASKEESYGAFHPFAF